MNKGLILVWMLWFSAVALGLCWLGTHLPLGPNGAQDARQGERRGFWATFDPEAYIYHPLDPDSLTEK